MSEEEIEGKMKQAKGKIREGFGKATDDKSEEFKGKLEQVEGKVTEGAGKIKREVEEEDDRAMRA